ncbi:MAG: glycine--tRNA ligase subunit beta [Cyanobacteria bacterium TGS_CYA1]|nr:glycine--tRNA ligase subunit beta [Cyanobacteria bacterium TGS_CYA1]
MTHKYLLEIGTEELPAPQIPMMLNQLTESLTKELTNLNLTPKLVKGLSTPRRLVAIVEGLPDKQPTINKKVKGPPVRTALDKDGNPTKAALGFADKQHVDFKSLKQEEEKGELYLVADVTIEGKPTSEVLSQIMPGIISGLTSERQMRWGDYSMKFSRPIRWIVSLFDDQVIEFELENLKAGRETRGHRILAPGMVSIASVDKYAETLKSKKVLVCPKEREEAITQQVITLAGSVAGSARRLSGSLLEEVVHITEWPCAIIGGYDPSYLVLPDRLLETIMVHHQRYFPIEETKKTNGDSTSHKSKKLLPYFIAVTNNDIGQKESAKSAVRQGNERVLKARLADGKFFYFDDQKTKLTDRVEALKQLTFQRGLGSYFEKSQRLEKAIAKIAKDANLDAGQTKKLEQIAKTCKLDLVTNLVGELPELQGYVGSWYAQEEGLGEEVAMAIAEHYAPRSFEDVPAPSFLGRIIAVVDKLDHLVGLFVLGKRPTGSSDPFALRRNAQGLVDTLLEGLESGGKTVHIDIEDNAKHLLELYADTNAAKKLDQDKLLCDLFDFLTQRLKARLLDQNLNRMIIESVLAGSPLKNIQDTRYRATILEKLVQSPEGLGIVRACVRIANIVDKKNQYQIDQANLSETVEKKLYEAMRDKKFSDDYNHNLKILEGLVPHIDAFFDEVMVNDPDDKKRQNRQALLQMIQSGFSNLGDFSKLQPLLP